MSGSTFLFGEWLSGGWLLGADTAGGIGRRSGADRYRARFGRGAAASQKGFFTRVLALTGVRTRFQQVDYRHFRELLDHAISGHVRHWGRDTYLYDGHNRLVAIKRAARFESNGRSTPTRYFVCRTV